MHFSGTHTYAIDAKGRVAIPARFREQIVAAAERQLYLTPAVRERHLKLYPAAAFARLRERIEAIGNPHKRSAFRRVVLSRTHEVALDGQGRILVPPSLRQWAELEGETYVVGDGDHIQLWAPAHWEAALAAAVSEVADAGTLLAELGF